MNTQKNLFCLLCVGLSIGIIESLTGLLFFRLEESFSEIITFVLLNSIIEVIVVIFCWFVWMIAVFLAEKTTRRTFKPGFLPVLCILLIYGSAAIGTQVRDSFPPLVESGLPSQSAQERENIILIIVDTLRQDRVGCFGNPNIYTPALDRFSRRSDLFTQAICQIPITAPSHLSLFSGLYPFEHGSRYNGMFSRPDWPLITELLKQQGYSTSAFVASAAVDGVMTGLSRGFDYYDDRFFFYRYDHRYIRSFPIRMLVNWFRLKSSETRSSELNKRIKSYLPRIMKGSPFFLWLHYYDPHMPYMPPAPYDILYDQDYEGPHQGDFQTIMDIHMGDMVVGERDLEHISALYDSEVSAVDRSLEDIFRVLYGQYGEVMDNTTIIFASDHGESLTEHDYYFFHAEKLYEPSLLVPLIFRLPVQSDGPGIHQDMVLLLDLYATILDRVGVQPDTRSRSQNLFKELSSAGTGGDPPRFGLSENGDRFFLSRGNHDLRLDKKSFSFRTQAIKYIRHPTGEEEMYNLIEDPQELFNVFESDSQRERFRTLYETCEPALRRNVHQAESISPETIEQLRSLGYVND